MSALLGSPLVTAGPTTVMHGDLIEAYSQKDFAEVVRDAEFAISEHNFRMVKKLHIGEAIRQRGNRAFPNHVVLLFCNLEQTEKMLALADDFIYHCPYRVSISATRSGIRVGSPSLPMHHRPVALQQMVREINGLLEKIVAYSTAEYLLPNDHSTPLDTPRPRASK